MIAAWHELASKVPAVDDPIRLEGCVRWHFAVPPRLGSGLVTEMYRELSEQEGGLHVVFIDTCSLA